MSSAGPSLGVNPAMDFAPPTTSLQQAIAQDSLGIGFSASGFLILYHLGVTAVLQQLGIITRKTRLAGSSGGAIHSGVICAGLTTKQMYETNMGIATSCRAKSGCSGTLDAEVRRWVAAVTPPDAAARCNGRLYLGVTEARANAPDVALLLGPNWSSNTQLGNAVAASSFLPAFSGRLFTAALASDGIPQSYDGGLTNYLPTPPGVKYAITVSSTAPVPGKSTVDHVATLTRILSAAAMSASKGKAADYLPLDTKPVANTVKPDIYPGLSGPIRMEPGTWNTYGLNPPDDETLSYLYDQGRADAAAWVGAKGLASASAIQAALDATTVAAITGRAAPARKAPTSTPAPAPVRAGPAPAGAAPAGPASAPARAPAPAPAPADGGAVHFGKAALLAGKGGAAASLSVVIEKGASVAVAAKG